LKKVEVENFTFELTKCEMSSGGRVTCDLLIINNDKKDRELQLTTQHSIIFDNFGNEYHAKEAQLANKEGSYPQVLLVSGVPTRAILTFDNVSKEAKSIVLLEIMCYKYGKTLIKVQFRNIPLTMGIIPTIQKEEVQEQTERKETSKEALKKVEVEKFTFELTKCEMSSGGRVTCDLLITNSDKDRELSPYATRIIDDSGNEYEAECIQLGSSTSKKGGGAGFAISPCVSARNLLVSGVPMRAIITFDNISQETRSIALLEINCSVCLDTAELKWKKFSVQLRNIPLSK